MERVPSGRCRRSRQTSIGFGELGRATGPEIWQLAQDVVADVHAKFGVSLEPEVNLVGGGL